MSALSTVRAAIAPLIVLALALCGCGGGGGGDVAGGGSAALQPADSGQVWVALTDADGDFLSYSVDVVSLTLKKANGDVVETLPGRTRVDFAQLVDLTEFLTAASVPNGAYVEGSIRLDYSDAEVVVEADGEPRAAVVQDESGNPLGTVDVQIVLDNANHVVVAPGRPAFLQLDFDLAATHTVDPASTPAVVVARPMLVASVEPFEQKEIRVRGPLVSVDLDAATYTIDVRPFLHRTARFGRLKVHTTAETVFEIDGETYDGAEGLAALAQLPAGSATAAYGTLDLPGRKFTAERVHAGSSVPGERFDVLWGNVTSRRGDRLTVSDGTLIRRSGQATYVRDEVILLVGDGTRVTRDGQRGNDLDKNAISIGQRIHAFGEIKESSPGELTLDATEGRVRLHLTKLWGTVKSVIPGLLTLDLDAIDGRRANLFDFAGTGVSPEVDANPDDYEVAIAPMSLATFPGNEPARVAGFVTPFGEAPPDFQARTVVDFAAVRAVMGISWGVKGTAAPFVSLWPDGLVIDHTNESIGSRHHIRIGPRLIDITALPSPPTLTPAAERGSYAIGQGRRVEVFADFERFANRLSERLGSGFRVVNLSASGAYVSATNTLEARQVHVNLTN